MTFSIECITIFIKIFNVIRYAITPSKQLHVHVQVCQP